LHAISVDDEDGTLTSSRKWWHSVASTAQKKWKDKDGKGKDYTDLERHGCKDGNAGAL
jgi:hypothetical protein